MEKKLKNDCQLNIERCAIIARLRRYLENVSISTKMKFVLNIHYRMSCFKTFSIKLKSIFMDVCEKIHPYQVQQGYDIEQTIIRFILILNIYLVR